MPLLRANRPLNRIIGLFGDRAEFSALKELITKKWPGDVKGSLSGLVDTVSEIGVRKFFTDESYYSHVPNVLIENARAYGSIPAKTLGYYFLGKHTSLGQRVARIGAAAGLYAGGAIGTRYLTGGTLTYNNEGESDIAGIPFI